MKLLKFDYPEGKWRCNDVALTSMWRGDVTSTPVWRHFDVMCLRGKLIEFILIFNLTWLYIANKMTQHVKLLLILDTILRICHMHNNAISDKKKRLTLWSHVLHIWLIWCRHRHPLRALSTKDTLKFHLKRTKRNSAWENEQTSGILISLRSHEFNHYSHSSPAVDWAGSIRLRWLRSDEPFTYPKACFTLGLLFLMNISSVCFHRFLNM